MIKAWPPLGYLAYRRSSLRGFEFPDLPCALESWSLVEGQEEHVRWKVWSMSYTTR